MNENTPLINDNSGHKKWYNFLQKEEKVRTPKETVVKQLKKMQMFDAKMSMIDSRSVTIPYREVIKAVKNSDKEDEFYTNISLLITKNIQENKISSPQMRKKVIYEIQDKFQ